MVPCAVHHSVDEACQLRDSPLRLQVQIPTLTFLVEICYSAISSPPPPSPLCLIYYLAERWMVPWLGMARSLNRSRIMEPIKVMGFTIFLDV